MRTETETLIKALRILSDDIQSGDGIANAVVLEGAERIEYLLAENAKLREIVTKGEAENERLKKSINTYKFAMYDENRLEKLKAEGIREAAAMCCSVSGYVVRDEQARKDLLEYADFIEKQLPINL